ncbi:MAG: hypothetical protein HY905_21125 [Deltaproteobacteria bacterium]|nr:hypothetical protein [Deltaproteobacteria bacterium]
MRRPIVCYRIGVVIAFFPPTAPALARRVAALAALLLALPGCGDVRPGDGGVPDAAGDGSEEAGPDGQPEDAAVEEGPDAAEVADDDDGGRDGVDALPEGCVLDECECLCAASGLTTGPCCDSPWLGSIYYWYPIGPDGCPHCECGMHRERECIEGCVQLGPRGEPACVEDL